MKKYLVGVLYYGPKDSEHERCMQALARHPRILHIAEISGCPYICIGRSTLAEASLKADAEGLLFIDHDILFDMEGVDQILESCDQTRAVVGGAYSMRSPGSKMIGGINVKKVDRPVVFFKGGGLYPADYLGMGFTAIHREAFLKMSAYADAQHARRQAIVAELQALLQSMYEPNAERSSLLLADLIPELRDNDLPFLNNGVTNTSIRPFFSLLQEEGLYFGEDVSFCRRAERAGVELFMDTRLRLSHKGSYTYTLEDCGLVVPLLDSLTGVISEVTTPAQSPVSPHPAIRAAIEQATGKSTDELLQTSIHQNAEPARPAEASVS